MNCRGLDDVARKSGPEPLARPAEAMLAMPAPVAAKAQPILLSPAMTAAETFPAIAQACLEQFQSNESLVLARQDPVALHQARVALRRLRSAFSIHRAMLTDARSRALHDDMRWLAGELGKARDLHVLATGIGKGPLRELLSAAHAQAYADAVRVLQSARARALIVGLAEWLAIGAWRSRPDAQRIRGQPARAVAAKALDRYRRQIRKGGRDLQRLDDAALHEVRKAGRKLLYAADFFGALFARNRERRRHRRFMRVLATFQDQLGAINDLATAPDVLARLGLADHPQASALLRTGKRRRLRAAAASTYDDLIDAKRFWR